MTETEAEFSDLALRVEASFREAVDEAVARQVSVAEFEVVLERLGWRLVESSPMFHVLADGAGRLVSVPATGPIGMAPLLKALRAAAGMDDAAA
jgi:hypothetical protein